MIDYITSYSQNFEDVMLWRSLKHVRNGFFIDIGAHHPVVDSVSKAFSEKGWSGIHVEPVPYYASKLVIDRPNDKVIQRVVSEQQGEMYFYIVEGTGLSTLNKNLADKYTAKNILSTKVLIKTISLDSVLETAPDGDIHWLKIDVEGSEGSVLRSWNNSNRRPWIIVIESTIPGTQRVNFSGWQGLLIEKGYKCVYSDGLNRFYIHKDQISLKKNFKFPPNIFDGFQMSKRSSYTMNIKRYYENQLLQKCGCAILSEEED